MKIWSLKKSVAFFVISLFCTVATAHFLTKIYRKNLIKKLQDRTNYITHIVQTSMEKNALSTQFLAEMMGLSRDNRMHGLLFSEALAEKRLLAHPLIQYALVKKMDGHTIFVDYELRKPVAFLLDYINTAIDGQGKVFPFSPYYPPQVLPEIYLGLFETPKREIAYSVERVISTTLEISNVVEKGKFQLKRVDVSNSAHPSLGRREVVIWAVSTTYPKYQVFLRLHPRHIFEQIENFLLLVPKLETMQKKYPQEKELGFIIDLRLRKTAYITKTKLSQ